MKPLCWRRGCSIRQVKLALGSLPVYIWTVRNTLWVLLFFSGRCLNWQRESISHARLIRLDFAPTEILLCFWAQRAHLSLNFADCRPAERRRPPCICKYFNRRVNKKKKMLGLNKQHAANLCILKQLTVPHIPDRWHILGHGHIISSEFLTISLFLQVPSHLFTWNPQIIW